MQKSSAQSIEQSANSAKFQSMDVAQSHQSSEMVSTNVVSTSQRSVKTSSSVMKSAKIRVSSTEITEVEYQWNDSDDCWMCCDAMWCWFHVVIVCQCCRISADTRDHTQCCAMHHMSHTKFLFSFLDLFSMPIQQSATLYSENFKIKYRSQNYQLFFYTFVNPNWLSVQKLKYQKKRKSIGNMFFLNKGEVS